MDEDEIRVPREREWAPRALDGMSIEALRAYRAQLEVEIARVSAAIAAKRDHLREADALFGD